MRYRIYAGTFLIAFATLALEIAISRLLSVVTWYHLAFFAVSTAMLGMTAGATRVFLNPQDYSREVVDSSVASACLNFALITPLSLGLLCLIPLDFKPTITNAFGFLVATAACSLPFYFSGMAVSAVLTKYSVPIGRLYASDLVGAAMGCLFVLGGLELLDAPSLILLTGGIGLVAALCFSWPRPGRRLVWSGAAAVPFLGCLILLNGTTVHGIRPILVKGSFEQPEQLLFEDWNSFSRVTVLREREYAPQYWGGSPTAPATPIHQHEMFIDGAAGTVMSRFKEPNDGEFLRFDVTNVAYYLRPTGGACIIGIGGGRDIQSALVFGHEHVTGIDVNPVFVELHKGEFSDFARIGHRKDVTLVVDEARSYLTRDDHKYAVVQMSLIDTWAATGAGAFSLSENTLYTVEAWRVFLDRLQDDGVFTVSRWFSRNNVGETGRMISLATAALLDAGVSEPSRHMAMITSDVVATLVICRRPFNEYEVGKLRSLAGELEFHAAILPGVEPEDEILRRIVSARSPTQLREIVAPMPLNFEPPTDEMPYFFNMLKLNHLNWLFASYHGPLRGNLAATVTLILLILCLLLLCAGTIVLPLVLRRDPEAGAIHWAAAIYFSLIGAGFMLVEIALIQRLSVYLGHPVYALGILLFTIICSSGIGSFLSDRLPLDRPPWMFLLPLVTAGSIVVTRFVLSGVIAQTITYDTGAKIAISVAILFPLGLLLGCFFPAGMRIARSLGAAETPWYWALNGVFGVLCSAVAVFISIYVSISTNFYIGALCYALLTGCLVFLRRSAQQATPLNFGGKSPVQLHSVVEAV